MVRPFKALDTFCKAGGTTKGLQRAGFYVVGVDIEDQKHYCGDLFVQGDALEFIHKYGREFDFIWASPVCKRYSQMTPKAHRGKHPDQIAETREYLVETGRPFAIENVPSARRLLHRPLMLCGSQFGLNLRRHRFIEISGFYVHLWPCCCHKKSPVLITGTHRRTYEPRYEYSVEQCREASGIDWMTREEIDQSVPPAYSEFIGKQAIQYISRRQP